MLAMTVADGKLAPDTVPDPEPGPEEVLIEVAAAGLNRADLAQVAGHYPPPPGAPVWPGLEVSGTIIAAGSDENSGLVGLEVCALLPGGGYAELVTVDAGLILPKPEGVDLIDAAGLPEVAATVYSNLGYLVGQDHPAKRRVLIHGGAGGIGTFAIQFAHKLLGAETWTTARSEWRRQLEGLGADRVIDYRTEDFSAEIRAAGGADAILDVIGAAYLEPNLKALNTDGRLSIIGLQKGAKAEIDLGALLTKRQTVSASTLRSRPLDQRRQIVADVFERVWPLLDRAELETTITTRLPLKEAAEAHRRMAAGGGYGKTVLTVE
ncbi:NAD(P)H-quinone oxidoreductase [Glycomyces buryatensis]|uniref:NAD(P)H-quinone oxidoreductase n=1 Tax=Glycomyces buryatensis TaxID=2570927 RepID=A0A4S8PZG2_9ACTN|nr:NAD(P)H-quinone oxidoreductase [Glycomyces buryatensis]THV37060.1 NAD(P)H-quinone oxidoreductase [Glycomyces buryatensis]